MSSILYRCLFSLPAGVVYLLMGIATWSAAVVAQEELQEWTSPKLGEMMPRADDRVTYYPSEPVEDQPTDMRVLENSFSSTIPLFQNQANEWTVSGKVRYQHNYTDARLLDTNRPLPDSLWETDAGTSYRHRFEGGWLDGWIGAAHFSIGSNSDQPYHSFDELIFHGVVMARMPASGQNAWIFSVIYASDQEILGGISVPFPGLAFDYKPSENFEAVIGAPFTSVEYKPTKRLTMDASYFPIRTVRVRAMYEMFRPLRLFINFDWDDDHYYLSGRHDKDDKFFYYDKRISGAFRFDLRHIGIEVRGGLVFDRFFFQGEHYSSRDHDRVAIASGAFILGGPSFRF